MTWHDCLRKSGCHGVVRAKGYFFHLGGLWEVVADADVPYHVTDALRHRDRDKFCDLDWGDIVWEQMESIKGVGRSEIRRLEKVWEQKGGPSPSCDLGRLRRKLIADHRFEDAATVVAVEIMAEAEGLL